LQKNPVKSILCMPIVHQGKANFLIYMEHSQIAGAFTEKRIEVLNMLSTQIAISIENSMLYDTMEQKVDERTHELLKANQLLELQHARINSSIRYAKTMQDSILPTKEELKNAFAEHFVIYRPKDIVSGDFYWYAAIDNKHILAVADCTGHGVPGAFMSMTGNSLLDEIVKQKKISDPSQILEALHWGIQEALRQRINNNKDGMDIGISVIERLDNQYILTYAGAKRPLYYVQNGKLEKLDADRQSIGGKQIDEFTPFQNTQIELPLGSVIYMSTDGFADQNNAQRKTLSIRKFIELLNQYNSLPLDEQGRLYEKELDAFMGQEQQRDDITVIGIRL
jgi:histidine kinase